MTLVDANVLLYAYDSESPHQALARQWLASELSSGRPVRLALITLLAFVRIATDRRVFTLTTFGAGIHRSVRAGREPLRTAAGSLTTAVQDQQPTQHLVVGRFS